MKRVIAIGLFVNAVLLAGILLKKDVVVHAAAGGGGGIPVGNGDVNGDGTVDISDAVYLLSSLFTGGPAPKAIECSSSAGKGLPATGQTKCYGDVEGQGWVEVPCGEATCPGQDGSYATGCPLEGRFVDNGDGTVTDTCTELMWQKDAIYNSSLWCDAITYCENLSFAGHSDWRLPNVRELESIIDYGRVNPSIDPVFGAGTWPDEPHIYYWSSTSISAAYAWYVGFDRGFLDVVNISRHGDAPMYVRAVRNSP
jgi:uncharacterized protein DUF1566